MRHRLVPIAFYLLVALALPAVASAEDDQGVKDTSKPVRAELEQEYARLEAALERNDTEAVLAFYLPEFRGEDCRGNTYPPALLWSRDLSMASEEHPLDVALTLGTIELNGGDEAVVTVRHSFSFMKMMKGKLRKVLTIETRDDTWVRTPEGWRLRLFQNIREFEWYVDGKRVGKGMPYDPDAPPYEPPPEG